MYQLSLTEHVMMSSDQRSSMCHPTNLLGQQCYTNSSKYIHSTTSLQYADIPADNYRAGLLTPEITVILFTLLLNLPAVRNYVAVIKTVQEDQLNFRRFPVFREGKSNSSRFSVFAGAVDTL